MIYPKPYSIYLSGTIGEHVYIMEKKMEATIVYVGHLVGNMALGRL